MMTPELELLKRKTAEAELDTFLIAKAPNIRYVTGFVGESAYVAVNRLGVTLFVNSLYIEHARATANPMVDVREMREGVFKTFSSLGESFWGKRVGLEDDVVTYSFLNRFHEAVRPAEPVPIEGLVECFRERKSQVEIATMTRAQRITEKVFQDILPMVREGVRELDLAIEIDYRFRKEGGDRPAFDTIVASGPNTSKPHAIPTSRALRHGDFVLFDMGAMVDGYASDMTRTVVLGKADQQQREIYYAVLDAQKTALGGIRAGMQCDEADRLARDVIERAQYGKEFVHTLGHGVGLEVHESPRLSFHSKRPLEPDMVVTVEPGIYLPDWGGVRIEDMVAVTETGCVDLTATPKELLEL